MKHKLLAAITLTALVAIPAIAEAAEGFATANVNMRSGPSTQYPAVTMIPVGVPLEINGCLQETPWCHVSFVGGRGWVAGRYIQATYQSRRIYVGPQYYRPLGIPTITFNVDDYWGRYYRGRDFYRERDRWREPGWTDRRPNTGWDRGPDRDPDWDNGPNRRPDRNPGWDGQRNDNQDWGNNRQDRRRDNDRQDDQQRRPERQQSQQDQQQPRPQRQQGENNQRPNAGSPGPYSPDHVDPCPASQPDCRMAPRGFSR